MDIAVDKIEVVEGKPHPYYDAVVIGAGPYGLSAAAHLRARGLKIAIFGRPMSFWREHMPEGMRMRSYWWATNLSDPDGRYDLKHYAQAIGGFKRDPFWLETVIDYGLWFQKQLVPDVDETYVSEVTGEAGNFVLTLVDGRRVRSATVVMAVGLEYYTYIPVEYRQLPAELLSHSTEHSKPSVFAGKHVIVVGGGQSAFEISALLHESGSSVDLVIRRPVRWVREQNPGMPAALRQLRAPQAGMGAGWSNLILEKYPYLFQRWPQSYKDHYLLTRNVSAASTWLKERVVGNVRIHDDVRVARVEQSAHKARLVLSNGETLEADHIMLATGYQADVRRLTLLHKNIIDRIETHMGYPVLRKHFESSVPGLYFLGFSAQRSFGPLYRFVVGVEPAARGVTRAIAQRVGVAR